MSIDKGLPVYVLESYAAMQKALCHDNSPRSQFVARSTAVDAMVRASDGAAAHGAGLTLQMWGNPKPHILDPE